MKITYDTYPEYQKCIQKLTWKWVKRSRFDFDELLSEANQAFLKAVDSYDSSKSDFHTHLYITVNGRLSHHIDEPETINSDLPDELQSKIQNPEQNCTFQNLIENMNKEAREVIETVLNTPAELIELVREMSSNRQGKMHVYKSNVYAFLKTKGWGHVLILKSFKEIKSTFS